MFTKEDYLNLAAVLSVARVEGIAQASWLVVTHDKLIKAANPSQAEEPIKLTEE